MIRRTGLFFATLLIAASSQAMKLPETKTLTLDNGMKILLVEKHDCVACRLEERTKHGFRAFQLLGCSPRELRSRSVDDVPRPLSIVTPRRSVGS